MLSLACSFRRLLRSPRLCLENSEHGACCVPAWGRAAAPAPVHLLPRPQPLPCPAARMLRSPSLLLPPESSPFTAPGSTACLRPSQCPEGVGEKPHVLPGQGSSVGTKLPARRSWWHQGEGKAWARCGCCPRLVCSWAAPSHMLAGGSWCCAPRPCRPGTAQPLAAVTRAPTLPVPSQGARSPPPPQRSRSPIPSPCQALLREWVVGNLAAWVRGAPSDAATRQPLIETQKKFLEGSRMSGQSRNSSRFETTDALVRADECWLVKSSHFSPWIAFKVCQVTFQHLCGQKETCN